MDEHNKPFEKEEKFLEQLSQIKKITDETMERARLTTIDLSCKLKLRENYISYITPAVNAMSKTLNQYSEMSKQISENMWQPIIELQKKVSAITAPFAQIQQRLTEVVAPIAKAAKKQQAIIKLGDNQLIWFGFLDDKIVDQILCEDNIDNLISTYLENEKYSEIDEIIRESRKSNFLQAQKRLYSQTISAYRKKHYNLACMGFVGVIDWLLSKTSGDLSASGKARIDKITNKMESEEVLDSFEISFYATFISIEPVMRSMFTFADFKGDEPQILNRHWIAHGRTQKVYTKLDCVKLINLIYALLLIGSVQGGDIDG